MLSRIFQLLLGACVVTSTVWAANDPFVGEWKVNPSKSKLNDEMKVEAVGANKYTFTFGPGQVDTVVADGSDQPALQGTTLSVTVEGPNNWKVVRKMKGRMLLTARWTLSEDGKTLNDAFTQYLPDGTTLFSHALPDGSTLFLPYVYERTAQSGNHRHIQRQNYGHPVDRALYRSQDLDGDRAPGGSKQAPEHLCA